MSNDKKAPPRRPDFEISKISGGAWDNQNEGGDISASFRVTFKKVQDRIADAKEDARDSEDSERRDDKRSANRETRQSRDNGPRYER